MRHPNRTGLARRDGKFVAESEPFLLRRSTRGERFETQTLVAVS